MTVAVLNYEAKASGVELTTILNTEPQNLTIAFSKKRVDAATYKSFTGMFDTMKTSGELAKILKPYNLSVPN